MTPGPRPPAQPIRVAWEPTDEDRRVEVHHVDARRRPWRAAAVAVGTLAVGAALVPRPLGIVAVVVVLAGAALAGVAAWRLPLIRSARTAPGDASVALDLVDSELTLRRDGMVRRLSPGSVDGVAIGSDHLFLHLVGGEVVSVPTRVFGRGGLDRFVAAVDGFRRSGRAPDDAREPGFDVFSLRFRLDARRIAPGEGRAGDIELRVLGVVALASLAVVFLASDPWGGGMDLALLGLFSGVLALVLGLSGRRMRLMVGAVHARFGPAGGRVHGPGGLLSFGWAEVREIVEGPDGVLLAFRDRVLPVPGTAFRSSEDQSRFVGAIEDWWFAARAPTPAAAPGRPIGDDPFAPPRP